LKNLSKGLPQRKKKEGKGKEFFTGILPTGNVERRGETLEKDESPFILEQFPSPSVGTMWLVERIGRGEEGGGIQLSALEMTLLRKEKDTSRLCQSCLGSLNRQKGTDDKKGEIYDDFRGFRKGKSVTGNSRPVPIARHARMGHRHPPRFPGP